MENESNQRSIVEREKSLQLKAQNLNNKIYNLVTRSIIVNGKPRGRFHAFRGLR